MEAPQAAIKICRELQHQGFDAYFVGGAVRDLITLGLVQETSDIDLTTSANPKEVKRILNKLGMRFFDSAEKFGTIGVLVKDSVVKGSAKDNQASKVLEITTFRKEGQYLDSRHPEKVQFIDSVAEDSNRRDFTIGAIYFDPISQELLDFHGGVKDLQSKVIRFILNPAKRIKEDPLRMLRAARLATTLNFKIAVKDSSAIKKLAKEIQKTSGQRIKSELDKIILSKNAEQGIQLLSNLNLLQEILPELEKLKKTSQSKDFHAEGNAFIHSLLTLKNIIPESKNDLILRYAALLHDIGKFGLGKKLKRNGREHIQFHGHGPAGSKLFLQIAERLNFSKVGANRIQTLIKHHMDLLSPEKLSEQTLQKLAKNKDFKASLLLRIADTQSSIITDGKNRPIKKDLSKYKNFLSTQM